MAQLNVSTAHVTLNDGHAMPQVGLGVWQAPRGQVTRDSVLSALAQGYRHIDTARIYGNEADVGRAVRDSSIAREQIFVTTKLWNDDQGFENTLRAFEQSLTRLGLDYIDLYLLHWPVAGKRLDSWRALEQLHREGRAKSIGVSNFLTPHLRELLSAAEVPPAANQIELTPFLQRRDTRELCKKHQIVVQAYSPLTRGEKLSHPLVVQAAHSVSRTPAQVLLRWGIQHGHVVLPKSTTPARIAENAALFDFELDAASMLALDGLEENLTTGWDPAQQT